MWLVGASKHFIFKAGPRDWKRRVLLFFMVFITVSNLSVIAFRWLPIPVTPLMLLRIKENILDGKAPKLDYRWVPAEQISTNMAWAVLASEDQKFTNHNGFDFEHIKYAFQHNSHNTKKVFGASTISQQTAKNVFLWLGRNWFRKGLEADFTVLIELYWSKARILEVYLNVIEMGDGIYGAEAASQTYFKHGANKITMREAALIAAVLPNPRRWNAGKPTDFVFKRQRKVINIMRHLRQPWWW